MSDNPKLTHLRALVDFRLKGKPIRAGQVISKGDFTLKTDWQNLLHMNPPRVEECSPVPVVEVERAPVVEKSNKAAMPGATKA